MSNTIVERIKAEQDARKSTRDTILHAANGPSPSPDGSRPAAEDVLSQLKNDVIPVIGKAISSEISAALDRVRRDLIECMERSLPRPALHYRAPEAPKAPVPTRIVQAFTPLETLDTDLDLPMPMDDVNRQLDQVFADMEPLKVRQSPGRGQPASAEKTAAEPGRSKSSLPEGLTRPPKPRSGRPALPGSPQTREHPPSGSHREPKPEASAPRPPAPSERPGLESLRDEIVLGIAKGLQQYQEGSGIGDLMLPEAADMPQVRAAEGASAAPSAFQHPGAPASAPLPVLDGTSGQYPVPSGEAAALMGHINQMEQRILGRIDSLIFLLGGKRAD